jgi:hypothetical protein
MTPKYKPSLWRGFRRLLRRCVPERVRAIFRLSSLCAQNFELLLRQGHEKELQLDAIRIEHDSVLRELRRLHAQLEKVEDLLRARTPSVRNFKESLNDKPDAA